jgi:hypothetical protein
MSSDPFHPLASLAPLVVYIHIPVSASTTSLISRLTFPHPAPPLSRLQTSRRGDARKTRLRPSPLRPSPERLTPVSHRQLLPAHYGPAP